MQVDSANARATVRRVLGPDDAPAFDREVEPLTRRRLRARHDAVRERSQVDRVQVAAVRVDDG